MYFEQQFSGEIYIPKNLQIVRTTNDRKDVFDSLQSLLDDIFGILRTTISQDFFPVCCFKFLTQKPSTDAHWELTSVFSTKECDKSKLNYKVCGNWLVTKFVNKNCLKNWAEWLN